MTTLNIAEPKAFAGANLYRNQLDGDSCITGVNGDILRIGPHCFDAESPSIFLVCVDNVETRLHINQLFKQQKNAILINCGTQNNLAMALIINGKEACLECVLDQSSKQQIKQRHPCLPIYRQMILSNQAPTSALASSNAARLAIELTRLWMLNQTSINKWVTDQNLQYLITSPLIDTSCKACEISYRSNVLPLAECMIENTASSTLKQIEAKIGHDRFELALPSYFIISDTCRICGKKILVNSSISQLFENDVRCEKCMSEKSEIFKHEVPIPEMIHTISLNSGEDILSKSLSDLGVKTGDTLQVKVFTKPETFDYDLQEFYCADDLYKLHSNRNVVI